MSNRRLRDGTDTPGPVPGMPAVDAERISRLRDVLAGGYLALEPDRQLAASLLERWPATASLIRAANEFHRRGAQWAVTGGTPGFPVPPARGVIFAASGYPLAGGFHAAAAADRPDTLFAYAEADQKANLFARALLASPDPLRVSAYQASADDPAGLLGAPEAQAVLGRGPVMVQLQLCCQWWPPRFCAWALAGYARLLPSGSTLALSLCIPGGGTGSAEFMADMRRAGSRIYPHDEGDVAAWVKAAGLELAPPGITDVRGRELGWAAAEFGRQRPVARVIEAVAMVPHA